MFLIVDCFLNEFDFLLLQHKLLLGAFLSSLSFVILTIIFQVIVKEATEQERRPMVHLVAVAVAAVVEEVLETKVKHRPVPFGLET